MGKKKLASNGQGGHGRGTPTTQVSKKTQERMEQMKKKLNSPEQQKKWHQQAMNSWLEGHKRLNQLENAKREAQNKKPSIRYS